MKPRCLRILQVVTSSEAEAHGSMILDLTRNADPARLFPAVLALTGQGPLARLAIQAGVPAVNWALKSLAHPVLVRRIQLFLREGNFDAVHCHGLGANVLTRWVARGMGLDVIATIEPGLRGPRALLDRVTADGVTAWMSMSEQTRREAAARLGIPHGGIFLIPKDLSAQRLTDRMTRMYEAVVNRTR